MKRKYRCQVCGILIEEPNFTCNQCDVRKISKFVKKNCAVCGEFIGGNFKHYIKFGNFCPTCSGRCDRKSTMNYEEVRDLLDMIDNYYL